MAVATLSTSFAARAIQDEAFNGRIKRLLPIHPFFGSEKKKTEKEMADDGPGSLAAAFDMFWKLRLPGRGEP